MKVRAPQPGLPQGALAPRLLPGVPPSLGERPCPWKAGFRETVLHQESTPTCVHMCAHACGSRGSSLDQGEDRTGVLCPLTRVLPIGAAAAPG